MFAQQSSSLSVRESLWQRVASFSLAAIFLFFAALQWNDPDPAFWMAIYGITALACASNAFVRMPAVLGVFAVLGSLLYAVYLWPAEYSGLWDTMDGNPGVEEAREAIGMLIVCAAFLYMLWRSLARVKRTVRPF